MDFLYGEHTITGRLRLVLRSKDGQDVASVISFAICTSMLTIKKSQLKKRNVYSFYAGG